MRRAHWLVMSVLLLAAWASFAYLALDFGQLFSVEAGAQMLKYVVSFFPPDIAADYLAQTWRGTLETVAISALGTLLAALFGMLLALPAA
ncbi:MAG: phosphonate ABC transporter, permease protein PhnE, partial [Betaproteobacteria bacterium]|nr:phosphonate ABC transporter, permease protein PhnE [Betaproteobacteria bacterium]